MLQYFLGLQKDCGQGQKRGERKGQGSESSCSQHFVHNRHGSKNLIGNWGQNPHLSSKGEGRDCEGNRMYLCITKKGDRGKTPEVELEKKKKKKVWGVSQKPN